MTHRILHIIPSLARDGTTKQLALLARGLPPQEFDVCVVTLNGGGPIADELAELGIEPHVIGRRWKIDARAFWRLRQYIRRLRPDLVHTWLFDANTYGRLAALSASVRRLVAVERSIDLWKMDHELAIDRRLAARTNRIVTNSIAVRDFYVARGLSPQKVSVIPGGVAEMEKTPTSRAELLTELGLPQDAKLIAYVGALTRPKRLKELIWATDQLKAVGTKAHLLIVGEGPLRSALERYRSLNHVDDRVHFLGRRDDVPRLLSHVDVLWQAGQCEGQSNAILEAMAASIPVVAADAAGNRELVITGTGYLVPLRERAGFARWTLPLLEDIQLAQRIGAAGRRHVLQHHRVENMLASYAELYRSLLG